jgi:hypothetical protein
MSETASSPAVGALLAFAERAVGRLGSDERVRVVWLTGSLAAGGADAQSDVDLRLAVRLPDFGSLRGWWPELVETVAPTVWRRLWAATPAQAIVGAISTAYVRFDLVVQPTDAPLAAPGRARVLLDKDGVADRLLSAAAPPRPDLAERTTWVVEEFIRLVGMLPIVVGRDDLPIGLEGHMACHGLLLSLLLLENGIDRATSGKRHVAPLLTDEQRRVVAGAPPLEPTMASVVAGRAAYARLFLPRARRLMAARGLSYPDAFEQATRRHLKHTLDLDI